MKRLTIGIPAAIAVFCLGLASGTAAESAAATLDNLQKAHNGELNAKARYEAFAVKADEEGYKSVAALFRAAANAEEIHAQNFAKTITKMGAVPKAEMEKPVIKATRENLEEALKGETAENTAMYPAFLKQAEADKQADAAMFFKSTMTIEADHAKLFQQALEKMDDWKAAGKEFAVCQVCGYTLMGKPPQKCPICASPREKFKIVK